MLQQTRVSTAVPYYRGFLARFPDIAVLATASLDEVLKAWEGLGYYARARNLHRAAKTLVKDHAGQLPGVGPYTAAAITSISFGRDEPVLDGNVTRVLCRVFSFAEDPTKATGHNRLQALARTLIPTGEASRFNQALMDLGALQCTPRTPSCETCPLKDDCLAHREGRETTLPVRRKRKRLPHYDIATGLVWDRLRYPQARLLIAKRKTDDMLGGLWEFPGGHREPGETLEECLSRELWEELRIVVVDLKPFVTVNHAHSHFRVTLHVFHCVLSDGKPQAIDVEEWRWVSLKQLHQYAFPTANRRIIDSLLVCFAPRRGDLARAEYPD